MTVCCGSVDKKVQKQGCPCGAWPGAERLRGGGGGGGGLCGRKCPFANLLGSPRQCIHHPVYCTNSGSLCW